MPIIYKNTIFVPHFYKAYTMNSSHYPSVLLIYTGGTIGMIENQETGALEAFNFDQLIENL